MGGKVSTIPYWKDYFLIDDDNLVEHRDKGITPQVDLARKPGIEFIQTDKQRHALALGG